MEVKVEHDDVVKPMTEKDQDFALQSSPLTENSSKNVGGGDSSDGEAVEESGGDLLGKKLLLTNRLVPFFCVSLFMYMFGCLKLHGSLFFLDSLFVCLPT